MVSVFSPQISLCRKKLKSTACLIRLKEEWREYLDKDLVIGASLIDLPKVFDCTRHDLLIPKLKAYGLGKKSVILNLFISQKPK